MDLSRRSLLFGGAAAGAGAALTRIPAAGAATSGLYFWALNLGDVVVPSDTWTKVPWDREMLNTTTVRRLPTDNTTWLFPAAAAGIYAIVANIAWDNARSPSGATISPPTHRKLARIPQQAVANPQNNEPAWTASQSDVTYHADLALRGDQGLLSDGSKGYQEQQVYIQAGYALTQPDQRIWIEVYQDSGMPLALRFDGTLAPKTATRPPMFGIQAPSLMVEKLCEF